VETYECQPCSFPVCLGKLHMVLHQRIIGEWGGIGCHLTWSFTSPGCLDQAVATIISLFFTQSLLGVSGLLEIKWQLSINSPNPPESLYKLLLFLQKWQVLPRPKVSSRMDGQAEQVKTWVATFHLLNHIISFEDTLK